MDANASLKYYKPYVGKKYMVFVDQIDIDILTDASNRGRPEIDSQFYI